MAASEKQRYFTPESNLLKCQFETSAVYTNSLFVLKER